MCSNASVVSWDGLENCVWLQDVAQILDDTWALVSEMPDPEKRYGSNPCNGKAFNSEFRKILSRKFDEVTPSLTTHASA